MTDRDRLRAAFEHVHRRDFLPPRMRGFAGEDAAVPIGHGQTCSQPRTVREMLELLEVAPGQRVLDVGSGSGWTTALLGELVGPDGEVVGVEIVPELVAWSRQNLAPYDLTWCRVERARAGVLGLPEEAPFDRVLVSAEATELPRALVDQLVVGGLLVVPVRGRMTVVQRTTGEPEVRHAGWYSFVPLVEP